ncbi:MAG: cell division protein ZapB [Spirochaetaceae bacterium]|jgi:DNA repair exonuclease SbcCD ATPase subunit|nr:cell division protein ZapB [Spirochaetaceae bacterium]
MGILENVKVLETKVDKEIDFAKRIIEENVQLKEKVALYQKRIEDLESLIQAFREEQNAIENGILAALNRLNQFEDAVEKKLTPAEAETSQDPPASDLPDSAEPETSPPEPVFAKAEPSSAEEEGPEEEQIAAAG